MAEDFKINISTSGDPRGAQAVADSLKNVGKAAEETSKGARTLGDDMLSLGSRNNATKDVIEGLDAALKGNTNSLFGVAKAAKNLFEIFTVSTPAGRALQLALIAVNSAALVFSKTNEQAGATAEKTAENFDAMREAAELFNRTRFDSLNTQLDALKAKGDSSLAFFKKLGDLSKALDDASLSLELAQLNADGSLSSEEKKARELGIRDRYGRRALQRDEGQRGEELRILRERATGTRAIADAAEAQRAMDAFLVGGIQGQRTDLKGRLNELYDQLEARLKAIDAQPGNNVYGKKLAFDEYQAAAGPDLAQIRAMYSPAAEAQLKTYEDRLRRSEAEATAKKKEADEAQRKLDDALKLSPLEQDAARTREDLAARTRYAEAGLALPGTRRPPESDVVRPAPLIDSYSLQQMGREQGKSAGQILREYQEAWERGLREEMSRRDVRIEAQR